MPAFIDESLAKSFRLNEESIKDLDALLRKRLNGIDASVKPIYAYKRKDGFTYKDGSVKPLLEEKNGPKSAITSFRVSVEKERVIKLNLSFEDGVRISGEGQDRADFLELITDIRTLVHDHMRPPGIRRLESWSSLIPFLSVFIAGIMISLYFTMSADHSNQRVAEWERLVRDAIVQTDDAYSEHRVLGTQRLDEARGLLESGTAEEQVRFLVQTQADRILFDQKIQDADPGPPPETGGTWSLTKRLLFTILVPVAVGVVTFLVVGQFRGGVSSTLVKK